MTEMTAAITPATNEDRAILEEAGIRLEDAMMVYTAAELVPALEGNQGDIVWWNDIYWIARMTQYFPVRRYWATVVERTDPLTDIYPSAL